MLETISGAFGTLVCWGWCPPFAVFLGKKERWLLNTIDGSLTGDFIDVFFIDVFFKE